MADEVQARAEAWIAANPLPGPSALGYFVKAQMALDAGEDLAAMRTALIPVVFATPFPSDYLAHCYAVAITAADRLGETQTAARLAAEMRARNLAWPDLPELEAFRHLREAGSADAGKAASADAGETALAEPVSTASETP